MSKISVVYWSQTGNTQAMAEAVGAGITKAGKEADVVEVSGASMEDLKAAKVFALGCPAMGAEVLEEMEMEPFVEEVEGFAQGKTIALFGSYGWRRSVDERLGRKNDSSRCNRIKWGRPYLPGNSR